MSVLLVATSLSGCVAMNDFNGSLFGASPEQRAAAKEAEAKKQAADDAPKLSYDKFRNQTVVAVRGRFDKAPGYGTAWRAAYVYEGAPRVQKPKPDAVYLFIYSTARDWRFLKGSREVIFLTDSGRITAQFGHDGDVGIGGYGQYSHVEVKETIAVAIEPTHFRAIALNSTPVEFSAGGHVFQFGPRGRNSLRGLLETYEQASTIVPGTTPMNSSVPAGSKVDVSTMSGTRSLPVGADIVLVLASGIEISGVFVGTSDESVELRVGEETKKIRVVELKDARVK